MKRCVSVCTCVVAEHRAWEKEKRRRKKEKRKRDKAARGGGIQVGEQAGDAPPLEPLPKACDTGGWKLVHKSPFTVSRPMSCLMHEFVVNGEALIPPPKRSVRTLVLC